MNVRWTNVINVRFLEVKRGRTSPLEFAWFRKVFPRGRLTVVGRDRFETDSVRGITMEELLLEGPEP